jgi:hypothetical protein
VAVIKSGRRPAGCELTGGTPYRRMRQGVANWFGGRLSARGNPAGRALPNAFSTCAAVPTAPRTRPRAGSGRRSGRTSAAG